MFVDTKIVGVRDDDFECLSYGHIVMGLGIGTTDSHTKAFPFSLLILGN